MRMHQIELLESGRKLLCSVPLSGMEAVIVRPGDSQPFVPVSTGHCPLITVRYRMLKLSAVALLLYASTKSFIGTPVGMLSNWKMRVTLFPALVPLSYKVK